MPTAAIGEVDLYYEIHGEGPWVLQVPGAVSGHEGYAAVTPAMAQHFRVIDYDPRGYGSSSRPRQRYDFDVWAGDMVALLDALEVDRAHVHGGSMGSTLALYFAANHPDRVRGLVLSGCSAKSDAMATAQYEVWKALARAYGTGSRELAYELCTKAVHRWYLDEAGLDDMVADIAEMAGRMVSTDVFCDACDALISTDVTPYLDAVVAPTLLIAGGLDVLTPAVQAPSGAGAAAIYDGLVNVPFKESVTIPRSAHANLLDSPEECLAAIIPFLQRVDRELGA